MLYPIALYLHAHTASLYAFFADTQYIIASGAHTSVHLLMACFPPHGIGQDLEMKAWRSLLVRLLGPLLLKVQL